MVLKNLDARGGPGTVGLIFFFGPAAGGLAYAFWSSLAAEAERNFVWYFFTVWSVGLVGLFVLVAVGGVYDLARDQALGISELTVPGELWPGAEVAVRYRRFAGTRRVRDTPQIFAELLCEERVVRLVGDGADILTRELYRRELQVVNEGPAGTVSGVAVIYLPVAGPPSLKLRSTEIVWSVKVRVQIPGFPDDSATFELTVLPAVASSSDQEPSDQEPGAP